MTAPRWTTRSIVCALGLTTLVGVGLIDDAGAAVPPTTTVRSKAPPDTVVAPPVTDTTPVTAPPPVTETPPGVPVDIGARPSAFVPPHTRTVGDVIGALGFESMPYPADATLLGATIGHDPVDATLQRTWMFAATLSTDPDTALSAFQQQYPDDTGWHSDIVDHENGRMLRVSDLAELNTGAPSPTQRPWIVQIRVTPRSRPGEFNIVINESWHGVTEPPPAITQHLEAPLEVIATVGATKHRATYYWGVDRTDTAMNEYVTISFDAPGLDSNGLAQLVRDALAGTTEERSYPSGGGGFTFDDATGTSWYFDADGMAHAEVLLAET
ncbi:MAG: hypothetical protein ACK5OX_16440 [Desertimonas sp.]